MQAFPSGVKLGIRWKGKSGPDARTKVVKSVRD